MPFPTRNLFTYCLAGIVLTGAFSRFSHGRFTSRFYEYQEYHQKDDGSATAKIVPCMDLLLGSLLMWRKTRLGSAIVIDMFFIIGLLIQMNAGKKFGIDLATIVVATVAALESLGV